MSPNEPATFLIDHQNGEFVDRKARFILSVETTDLIKDSAGICMIVAVYNKKCPLHDRPSNVRNAEKWATALKSATMTIRTDKFCFVDNFYVSVVVLPDDRPCNVSYIYGDKCYKETQNDLGTNRVKEVIVKIDKIMPYNEYWIPIFIPILVMFLLIFIAFLVIKFKTYGEEGKHNINFEMNEVTENMNMNGDATDCAVDANQAASDFCRSCEEALKGKEDKGTGKRAKKGMIRLKDQPTFADSTVCIEDKWFRRNRSRVYIYLVPLISIFYFVPAIQFVFQVSIFLEN